MPARRLRSTSQRVPALTGMALDRATGLRTDPTWVARQLHAAETRAVGATREGVLLDGSGQALLRFPLVGETSFEAEPILLGLEGETALFAVDLEPRDGDRETPRAADGERVVALRDAGRMLPQSEGGLAAYAVALLGWHRRHRFCANCGSPTEIAEAGYSRRCPNCGASHFPRTDPVVIMLVESEDRVLLGRRAGWPGRRLSVLAGFVSPGETLEEAVVREVREEAAIAAYDPVYVASQPWPFPASLMLAFTARADGGRPEARDGELAEVGWYSRQEVRAAAESEDASFALPPPVSVARFLIDRWLDEE